MTEYADPIGHEGRGIQWSCGTRAYGRPYQSEGMKSSHSLLIVRTLVHAGEVDRLVRLRLARLQAAPTHGSLRTERRQAHERALTGTEHAPLTRVRVEVMLPSAVLPRTSLGLADEPRIQLIVSRLLITNTPRASGLDPGGQALQPFFAAPVHLVDDAAHPAMDTCTGEDDSTPSSPSPTGAAVGDVSVLGRTVSVANIALLPPAEWLYAANAPGVDVRGMTCVVVEHAWVQLDAPDGDANASSAGADRGRTMIVRPTNCTIWVADCTDCDVGCAQSLLSSQAELSSPLTLSSPVRAGAGEAQRSPRGSRETPLRHVASTYILVRIMEPLQVQLTSAHLAYLRSIHAELEQNVLLLDRGKPTLPRVLWAVVPAVHVSLQSDAPPAPPTDADLPTPYAGPRVFAQLCLGEFGLADVRSGRARRATLAVQTVALGLACECGTFAKGAAVSDRAPEPMLVLRMFADAPTPDQSLAFLRVR